jgi:tetratricopeptide (TPR) repeat protein
MRLSYYKVFLVLVVFASAMLCPWTNRVLGTSSIAASACVIAGDLISINDNPGQSTDDTYLLNLTVEQAGAMDEKAKTSLLARYQDAFSRLIQQRKVQQALDMMLKANQIFPSEQIVMLNVSGCHAMMDDWQKSLDFALKALDVTQPQIHKSDSATVIAAAHNNAAQAYMKMKSSGKAIEHLKKALELQPDMGGSNYLMGEVLAEEGKHEESTVYFGKAFTVSPKSANPEDYSYYGYALGKCGKKKEAIEISKQGMERYPLYPGMHFNYASMLSADKRNAEAIYELHVELLLFRGSGRYDTEQVLQFMGGLMKEVLGSTGSPDHEEVTLLLASIKTQTSLNVLKTIEKSSSKHYLLNVFLAEAYANEGKNAMAKVQYQKVLADAPFFVPAYVEMGQIYEAEKDMDNAVMLYKKAVSLMPDNWKVKALIKEHPELAPK